MKRLLVLATVFVITLNSVWTQTVAFGFGDVELDRVLNNLNVNAKVDSAGFTLEVTSQWGVSSKQVSVAISNGLEPADIYVAAFLSKTTGKSFENVVSLYNNNKKAGWGEVAKSLGIKPGSKEFKLLKDKSNASEIKMKGKKKK